MKSNRRFMRFSVRYNDGIPVSPGIEENNPAGIIPASKEWQTFHQNRVPQRTPCKRVIPNGAAVDFFNKIPELEHGSNTVNRIASKTIKTVSVKNIRNTAPPVAPLCTPTALFTRLAREAADIIHGECDYQQNHNGKNRHNKHHCPHRRIGRVEIGQRTERTFPTIIFPLVKVRHILLQTYQADELLLSSYRPHHETDNSHMAQYHIPSQHSYLSGKP